MFGITETTVHVTYKEITKKEINFNQSNIGRPIPTMKLFVLGRNLELLPVGVPGELFIEGAGVACGYLNQPELSQQKFVENPFIPGDRLYRSGDAGRVLDNGDIEYLGRIDNQIQLRGFRVELGEIENQLLKHKDIQDAVVMACEDKTGYNYLCGYIVSARPLKVSDLRDFLAQKLPYYMIPGYYVELEKIPLTTNGKVDIKALPEPEAMGGEGDTLPRNEIDEAISGIWKRELGLKKVSINDSFFNLGGDSIKAINLLNSINNALNSKLKIEDIFTYETIEKLSDHVYASSSPYRYDEAQQSREAVIREFEVLKNRVLSLHPRTNEIEDIFPMSDIQKGMVFYSVRNSSQAIYFDQFIDQLKYPNFDLGIFKKALTLLVDKHPILRTSFNWTDFDEPVQIVYKASAVEFKTRFINLSNMKRSQQEAFIKELMEKERREPFDLSVPPLMRSVVLALGYDRLFFLWDIHHAISDGWSHASLMTEINNTYLSLKTDAHFLPERLQSSYKDYVIEQVQVKRNNRIIEFWKKELEDYKRIDFSLYKYDTPVKQDDSRRPRDVYSLDFETDYWTELQEISHRYEVSIKNICFGAYLYMLSKLLYENDILVGLITHNRPVSKDGEKIMGCFLNTVPVRVRIPNGLSWAEYIKFINRKLITLKRFDKLSFFEILRQIGEKTQDNNPLFDTVFNFVDFHVYNQLKPRDVSDTQENEEDDEGSEMVSIEKYEVSNTLFDFHVNASPGSYRIDILYSNLIFSAHQVEMLGGYFKCALDNMICNTDGILSKDTPNSEAERKTLLEEFNNTGVNYPKGKTVAYLFQEQVEKSPDFVALVRVANDGYPLPAGAVQHIQPVSLTYRELNEQSGRLAHLLVEEGVWPNAIVGIMVERSEKMIIGILAILKAGGVYLPIDPGYPHERIHYMLTDSNAEILISDKNNPGIGNLENGRKERAGTGDWPVPTYNLTRLTQQTHPNQFTPLTHVSQYTRHPHQSLAYIIYTSGTTGRPKGVMVEQGSVVNLLFALHHRYPLKERDTYLLKTSYLFDVSVTELFGWFLTGGRLAILEPGEEKNPNAILDMIALEGVTHINFVPSVFNTFVEILETRGTTQIAGLKYIFLAGEALLPVLVHRFRRLNASITIENIYGPTEATVYASWYSLHDRKGESTIPIGKPLPNVSLYIIDKDGFLQPIAVPGELCVGGEGLARGYLNKPELTCERFILYRPYTSYMTPIPKKLYKTGDLARWQPDGNVEFLGRIDSQIKIRGFRIELGEIENRLVIKKEIKEAVVNSTTDKKGEPYLCAYFTSDIDLSVSVLREHLSRELPDYMIPTYFIRLDSLPVTLNGKIDKRALPLPDTIPKSIDFKAPRDSVDKMIAAVWAEVLGIDRQHVTIDANFFEIGGHSLRAMSLVAKLQKNFDIKLQLSDLFKNPTIRKLAELIKSSPQHRYLSVKNSEKMEHYPLSSAQKRLYILYQFDQETIGYNMPSAFLLEGEVDMEKLENAFHLLVQRHESLRTSFHLLGGESRQIIREPDTIRFEIRFFHGSAEKTLKRFVKPFQLEKAPLFQVGVNRLRENETLLMVNMHHIISDGVSLGILVRDFLAIYENNLLPPLKLQYRDYSQWQNSSPVKKEVIRQKGYWLKRFENIAPVLELPTDFNRPSIQSFEGAAVDFKIDAAAGEALNRLASRHGCTLFMAILSLYNILLAKISGSEYINIGTPVAGRRHADLESIIGIFLNILILRSTPQAHRIFADYLPDVKKDVLEAFENQDYPYEELVNNLSVNRDMSRNPLFDVMFVFQNMDIPDVELPQLKISPYRFKTTASIFDMTLVASEGADGISFSIEYCSKLFTEENINRFVYYFKNTIQWVIDNPGTRISEIEIITPREKQLILADFNDTILDYPREKLLHELFERQAAEVPTGIASICGDRHITYCTLNEKTHRLANRLRCKGVGADSIVGLLVERSLEMMIGILGILKAGGAYMPCDPNFPGARLDYMLQRSGTRLVVSQQQLINVGMENQLAVESEIIDIHSSLGDVDKPAVVPVKIPPARSNQLAYVIFTSGSTGNPKGIMIEHRNVVNFIEGVISRIDFSPGATILAITTISFDIFVLEILLPLSRGLKVVIANEREQDDPDRLKDLILKADIDLMQLTPTRLKMLTSEQNPGFLKTIDTLMVGGETFPTDLFEQVREIYDGKLYNMYGPTETTVWSSIKDLTASQGVTIGPPIANTQLYILDKNKKIQPVGIVGELWIGGDGTARGYLDDVQLNREKFTLNPFIPGNRIYHTGDLARWLPDGDLEFLGRIDHQVKIRGFRIETGEIEYAMENIDHITQAAVIPKQDAGGNNYLCAYYVSNRELAVAELRKYLSDFLPAYMIPSYFVKLEMFPLTPNMKIDRNAFPDHQLKTGDGYVAPTTGVQEMAVKVWSEVLGIREENLSVNANFFELGGDSLKAVILVSKSHQVFDVKVPLPVLFKKPTVKDFSQYIEASEKGTYQPITPVEKKEYYPLSAAQMRLYVIYRMEPESLRYNFPQAYTLEGRLDKEILQQSFEKLIDRHRSLKTSFRMVEGQPVQKIVSLVEFHMIYHEIRHWEVVYFLEDFVTPFDLSAAPILRVGLVKAGENTHILILDMHHIISDYFSNEILIGELRAFYRSDRLHPLKLQYTDYSRWHRKQLESEKIKEHEAYWLEVFKDEIPVLQLPFDHPRSKSGVENNAGTDSNFTIKDEMFEKLTRLSNETGVTLYIIFLTIYYLLLYKYTGSEDIVIGSPSAGRGHADLENIIGVFVNILAMRNKLARTRTFKRFLTEVKINSQKAVEHQDFQFDDLVKKLGLQRDAWKNPLFDCVFNYMDYRTWPDDENREDEKETVPSLKITPYVVGHIESPFDLLLTAEVRKEVVSMTFTYPKALYEKMTIENMIKNYLYILQQVIENVDINIADIKLSHDLLPIESSSQRLEQVDFEF